ncbi:BON domain-containing protein [Legionella londiniensis]|uniref:Phospholipid binding protein n=1 Tax=Legionella londiniensis TaxID=45068 RepID=A0A0W0VSW0_9GAMM|nr:BON domain-containing protein [Legionella londiniensis]KTD23214.1 phospholipid binding protein [Legionella londiniensis]STX93775.1 phospholipid binding protein [Legionella londiniensis]
MRINLFRKLFLTMIFTLLMGCQGYNAAGGIFNFPLQSSDESLQAAVSETLRNHKLLRDAPLHVEVANGVVYLSGYVKTIRQSDTAAELAGKINGVKYVQNDIVVRK